MARGFFTGIFIGVVAASGVVATYSVLTRPPLSTVAPKVSGTVSPNAIQFEIEQMPSPELVSSPEVVPQMRPQSQDIDDAPDMDAVARPLDVEVVKPEIEEPDLPQAIENIAQNTQAQSKQLEPVLPSPEALFPSEPTGETSVEPLQSPVQIEILSEETQPEGVTTVTAGAQDKMPFTVEAKNGARNVEDVGQEQPNSSKIDASNITPRRDQFPPIEPNALPAIEEFGQPKTDPEELRPRFSIILFDDASKKLPLELVEALPRFVTIAIDAAQAGAEQRAVLFDDLGFELAIALALNEDESNEVMIARYSKSLSLLPTAVAIVEQRGSALVPPEAFAERLLADIGARGLGVVLQPKGLRRLNVAARDANVPIEFVYRDLDDKSQRSSVIRRFLDGAAFVARQNGSVTMFGRTQAETIEAITKWTIGERSRSVIPVRLSTILAEK